jgi:hypothetical protein
MMSFSKILTSTVAALTLGAAVLATSAPAEAGWRYRRGYYGYGYGYGGGALAAGLIGGLALGAIAASAAAAQPVPVSCYWVKRQFVSPRGYLVTRREQVCG